MKSSGNRPPSPSVFNFPELKVQRSQDYAYQNSPRRNPATPTRRLATSASPRRDKQYEDYETPVQNKLVTKKFPNRAKQNPAYANTSEPLLPSPKAIQIMPPMKSPARDPQNRPDSERLRLAKEAKCDFEKISPRTIAKMDRNSLELEVQTLMRKLEVVSGDKKVLASAIDTYEHDLCTASNKLHATQENLRYYETEANHALQRARKKTESLQKERDRAIEEADQRKRDFVERKAQLEKLRGQLSDAGKALVSTKHKRDVEYEDHIDELEHRLAMAEESNQAMKRRMKDMDSRLRGMKETERLAKAYKDEHARAERLQEEAESSKKKCQNAEEGLRKALEATEQATANSEKALKEVEKAQEESAEKQKIIDQLREEITIAGKSLMEAKMQKNQAQHWATEREAVLERNEEIETELEEALEALADMKTQKHEESDKLQAALAASNEKDFEIADLQEQVEQLQNLVDSEKEESERFIEKQEATLLEQIHKANSRAKKAETEHDTMEQEYSVEIAKLKSSLSASQEQCENSEAMCIAMKEKLEAFTQKHDDYKLQIASLKKSSNDNILTKKNLELQGQIQLLKQDMSAASQKFKETEEVNAARLREAQDLNAMRLEEVSDLKKAISELSSENEKLAPLESELKEARKQLKKMEELEEKVTFLGEQRKILEEKATEKTTLEVKLNLLSKKHEEKINESNAMKEELTKVKEEAKCSDAKNLELENKLLSSMSANKNHKDSSRSLENELSKATDKMHLVDNQMKGLYEKLDAMHRKNKDYKGQLSILKKEYTKVQNKHTEAHESMKAMEEDNRSMKDKMQTMEQQIAADKEEALREAQTEKEKAIQEVAAEHEKVQVEANEQILALKKQIQEVEETLSQAKEQHTEEMEQKETELKEKLSALQAESDSAQEGYEKQAQERTHEIEVLREEILQLGKDKGILKRELEAIKEAVFQAPKEEPEAELVEDVSEDDLKREQALLDEIDHKTKRILFLERQLSDAEQRIHNLETHHQNDLESWEAHVADIQNQSTMLEENLRQELSKTESLVQKNTKKGSPLAEWILRQMFLGLLLAVMAGYLINIVSPDFFQRTHCNHVIEMIPQCVHHSS